MNTEEKLDRLLAALEKKPVPRKRTRKNKAPANNVPVITQRAFAKSLKDAVAASIGPNPSPAQVFSEYYKKDPASLSDAVGGIRSRYGKGTNNFLRNQAMNKVISSLRNGENRDLFKGLNNQEMELLLIEDDIPSIWNSIKTTGSNLWSAAINNPKIVDTAKSLLNSGLTAVSALVPELAPITSVIGPSLVNSGVDWIASKSSIVAPQPSNSMAKAIGQPLSYTPWSMNTVARTQNTMRYANALDVNLEYVAGALSPNHIVVPHPEDNPEYIYTAQQSIQFTVTANASGAFGVKICPYAIYSTASSNDGFYYINNANAFVPTSATTTGSWVGTDGPQVPNVNLFNSLRLIELTVDIIPAYSLNQASGTITANVLSTALTNTGSGTPNTLWLSLAELCQIPNTETTNMQEAQTKNVFAELIEGDQWASTSTSSYQNAGTTNVIYVIGTGLGITSGNVTFRITYGWGAKLTPAGMAFATPRQPDFGNYTNQFLDFLRKRFPNITNWTTAHIDKLLSYLMGTGSSDYNRLIDACSSFSSDFETRSRLVAGSGNMQEMIEL